MANQSQRRPPAKAAPRPASGPSNAVATTGGRGTLTSFIETYEGDFSRVMPGHVNVQAFVGLAAAYVRRDEKLREAAQKNPASLILALRECAALGHTPVPKIFALVPFRDNQNKANNGWNITGIETYHGVIERMYRAGGVQSVHCELVRRNDDFGWSAMEQRVTHHRYDPFATEAERGDLMGVYAWARLFNGAQSQVAWLNREQVMKHRAVSRSGDAFWGGPWEPDMWRKTGMHALERWVPTSAEYRWQVALSGNAAASGFTGIPDVPVLEYGPSPDDGPIDAELVDDPPPPARREQRQAPGAPDRGRGDQPDRAMSQTPAQPAVDDMDGADPDNDPELPDPDAPPAPTGPDGWPAVPEIPNRDRS
jgi:recombination protein RecT